MVKHHLRRSRRAMLHPGAWRVRALLWGGGIVVGLAAAAFTYGSESASGLFHAAVGRYPWLALVITPLGLMIIAGLTRKYFPGSEGSGVPQTIAAMGHNNRGGRRSAKRSALLSLRIAFGKLALATLGNACGGSIGRGGVMVQAGASIVYALCRYTRYTPATVARGAILAGGAAGLAAAFNTPLAGVVFAIEGLGKNSDFKHGGVILVTVALAGVVSLALLGASHYLDAASARAAMDISTWGAVVVCGVAGGLLGGFFSQALITLSDRLRDVAARRPLVLAFVCGLVVAGLGLISVTSPHGSGYTEATAIIAAAGDGVGGGGATNLDPFYPFAKMAATIATYLSGVPCGLFSPTLSIGAGLGVNIGHWLPLAPLAVMALLGMTGYFAGVMQTPITAMVIVMEMTNNQTMALPIIVAALIADGCSRLVCPRPLFAVMAERFTAAGDAARR